MGKKRWCMVGGVAVVAATLFAFGCSAPTEPDASIASESVITVTSFSPLPASATAVYTYANGGSAQSLSLSVSRPPDAVNERAVSTSLGTIPLSVRVKDYGASRDTDSFLSPFDGVLSVMPRSGTSISTGVSWSSSLSPALLGRFAGNASGAYSLRSMKIVGAANLGNARIVRAEMARTLAVVQRRAIAVTQAPDAFGVVDFVVTAAGTLPARVLYLRPRPGVTATTLAMTVSQPHDHEVYCLRSATGVAPAELAAPVGLPLELSELASCYAGVTR